MPNALTLASTLAVLAAMTVPGAAQTPISRAELAPTGTLRVGLVEAPSAGVLFIGPPKDGKPEGVTADLSADLAKTAGLPLTFTVFPNTGAATAAL